MNDFRSDMIHAVKAAGQRMIDHSEDIVGNAEMLLSLKIEINFDGMETGLFSEIPEIKIKREHLIEI